MQEPAVSRFRALFTQEPRRRVNSDAPGEPPAHSTHVGSPIQANRARGSRRSRQDSPSLRQHILVNNAESLRYRRATEEEVTRHNRPRPDIPPAPHRLDPPVRQQTEIVVEESGSVRFHSPSGTRSAARGEPRPQVPHRLDNRPVLHQSTLAVSGDETEDSEVFYSNYNQQFLQL